MEKLLRVVNTVALLGILAVLVLILVRLPQTQHFPTAKDAIEAKDDQSRKDKLRLEIPYVRVDGTVDVDVTNTNR